MIKEKIKNNKLKTFVIALLVVVLLTIGAYFTMVAIDRHNQEEIDASRDVEKKIALYLDKDQMEIFENIYNAKMPKGKYIYEISFDNGDPIDDMIFVSGDNRMIDIQNDEEFSLIDKKNWYVASEEYKTFYKRDLSEKSSGYNNVYINKNYLDYGIFFNSKGNNVEKLIEGLDIEKNGDNYIIKNDLGSLIFDKDYTMIQSIYKAKDRVKVTNLVDYDEDFDKYYNEYFNKLKKYDEVDSYDELEKVFHKKKNK